MSVKLIALTLNTSNLPQQKQFYQALGFDIETIKVTKGSECYRARPRPAHAGGESAVGEVGFEIILFGLKDKKNSVTPIFQLCFSVTELDSIFEMLSKISGVEALLDPTDMPDGRKAIVKDPDGNSIEIIKAY